MPHSTTWVVVANSAHAKIFRLVKFPKIEEILTLEHPESRLHNQDLVSTEPGRGFDSQSGGTRRHAYQSEPKQVEIEKFAKELSNHLNLAHEKGAFSRLYLVISPSFLGLVRQHIDPKTYQTIVAEIIKDMNNYNAGDIEQQLAKL